MTLTKDQESALNSIDDFLHNPTSVALLLEGGAGVGKTFLLGQLLHRIQDRHRELQAKSFIELPPEVLCVAAPTHKAIGVLRRKLNAFGIEWCLGYDDY